MKELKSRHLFTLTMKLPPTLEFGDTPAELVVCSLSPADNLSAIGFLEKSCHKQVQICS